MAQADRVAVITGAAGAIGGATAVHLARERARVVLADAVPTQAVATRVEAAGGRCTQFALDVRRRDEIEAVVAKTLGNVVRLRS